MQKHEVLAADERPQLVSIEEACRMLATSRSAVYAMMERGELSYVKLGRSRRLTLSSIKALVQKNTVSRSV
jgi:excisionase family DNA binding protein